MNRLSGRTALITGAARGLGAQIARRFAEEGARVIINDLSLDAASKVAEALGGHALACDVSDSAAVAAMFGELRKITDTLDILVNNAGIGGLEAGDNAARARIARMAEQIKSGQPVEESLGSSITEVTDADWRRMMGVHLDGTFYCSREAVKLMQPRQSGAIVNMGSIMGTFGRPGGPTYSAAKAGILGFTRALAHELAPHIRVNALAPGWIRTDMTDPLEPLHFMLEAQTPLGRLGEPDDIAWAAVYLASDEAKFVTGQVLSPNGGWYMSQ